MKNEVQRLDKKIDNITTTQFQKNLKEQKILYYLSKFHQKYSISSMFNRSSKIAPKLMGHPLLSLV